MNAVSNISALNSAIYLLYSPVSKALSSQQIMAGDEFIKLAINLADTTRPYLSDVDAAVIVEALEEATINRLKADRPKGLLDAFFAARGYRKTSQMAYHKTSVLAAKAEAMRRAIEAADQSAGVAEISAVVNELELEEEPDSEALPAYVHTEAPSVQSEAADNELQAHSVLMETFTSDDNNDTVTVVTSPSTGFDWAKYIQEMQSLPSHADDAADEDADEDANEDAVSSDTDSDANADVGKEEIEA